MDEDWLRYHVGLAATEVRRRLEALVRFNNCNPYWIATFGQQAADLFEANHPDLFREGVARGWIKVHR